MRKVQTDLVSGGGFFSAQQGRKGAWRVHQRAGQAAAAACACWIRAAVALGTPSAAS